MTKLIKLPTTKIYTLYKNMLEGGHLLIAGAQGSGKSILMQGLLHTAICHAPGDPTVVIIDPKCVDYIEYADLPHVAAYVTERQDILNVLKGIVNVMMQRYDNMQQRRIKEYDGGMIYVFIDELADLMTDKAYKRQFEPILQRLTQLGRAAHITIIAASQCCLASVISTPIKCNFASRVALRVATAQDSRNIIDIRGAETLPNPRTDGTASAIWRNGVEIVRYDDLPRYDDAERQRIIDYWTSGNYYIDDPAEAPSKPQQPQPQRRGLLARLFGRKAA